MTLEGALWAEDIELSVQIGLGLPGDNVWTLDDPTYSNLDKWLLGSPDSPYSEVLCDVRTLTFQSGATRADGILTRWEAGTASLVLDNRDGLYDLTAQPARLLPMIGLRIRARMVGDTVWQWLFMGYVDSAQMNWDENLDATVTVTATDGTKLLSAYDGPEQAPVGANETAAQRASRILDEAQWQYGRRITAGGTLRQSTTLASDAWAQLLLNQDAELGDTYIDTDGVFVFVPRSVWLGDATDPTVVAEWGPDALRYESAHVVNDDTNLRNIVDVAHPGGTVSTVRDDASVTQFLPHRYGREDLPFTNTQDDLDWANLVLQTASQPAARIDSIEVVPQTVPDELWPVVLAANYADHWAVTVQTPGMAAPITQPVQLRGWVHTIDVSQWRIVYTTTEAVMFQPFILDDTSPNATLDVMRLT